MNRFSVVLKSSRRLDGFSRPVKKVDEVREVNVKKMCGSSLELHKDLFVDLSTF